MKEIPPLFIGAAGRSGTTLLVDMLGLHSEISPIYETDFVTKLAELFYSKNTQLSFAEKKEKFKQFIVEWSKDLPKRPHNKRSHERYVHGPHYICFGEEFIREETEIFLQDLTPANLDESIRSYLKRLYTESAEQDEKEFWINKTPIYVLYPELLLRWFPDMKFIHIVRDGRDVALSVLTRPWGPDNFKDAAGWWKQNVISGMEFGSKHPDNYIEVKYEDLIVMPQKTLLSILNECIDGGVSYSEVESILQQSYELDSDILNKWTDHSPQSDIDEFMDLAKPLLSQFGYIKDESYFNSDTDVIRRIFELCSTINEAFEHIISQLHDSKYGKVYFLYEDIINAINMILESSEQFRDEQQNNELSIVEAEMIEVMQEIINCFDDENYDEIKELNSRLVSIFGKWQTLLEITLGQYIIS